MGYSPYGCKESDTTEETQHACTHISNTRDKALRASFMEARGISIFYGNLEPLMLCSPAVSLTWMS